MSNAALRASDWRAVFYGHSFLTDTAVDSTTERTMRGRGVPFNTAALGGYGWYQLDDLAATRLHPWAAKAPNTVLIMVGGTADYALAFPETTVMTNMTTVATDARTAGFDKIINTTTCAATSITGGNETNRTEGNTLLLAEAGGAVFDYVVDLAADSALAADIAANDGVHPLDTGKQRIADLLGEFALDLIPGFPQAA